MLRHLWWILSVVLVCSGLIVALSSPATRTDEGWFAYTPLDDAAPFTVGAVIVSRWQVAGVAIAVSGLVVAAAGIGFLLGRRHKEL